jgi:hypothetical protein
MASITFQSYLGKFSRGKYVNLLLEIPQLPDLVPIVALWNGSTLIDQIEMPRIKAASVVFRLTKLLDNQYTDGQYMAAMRFVIAGNTYCSVGYFQVVGGDGTAPNIAISEIDRAAGRAVVSQDNEGYIRLGYRPRKIIP